MIDVTFSIISGTKQTLRLQDTTTVGEAKQTLSVIADSPPHTLTLLHKARILKDTDRISDLDFSSRKFIAVGIRRKSLMIQKHTGNIDNNEDETSPLKAIFGDSFATVRRHFLENPASVPILISYIARSDPVNARLLSESPQILLRFLGISPEEFLVAINNMTQRYQQDQTNQQGQNSSASNQNQPLPIPNTNENHEQQQNIPLENQTQPVNSEESHNNENCVNVQPNFQPHENASQETSSNANDNLSMQTSNNNNNADESNYFSAPRNDMDIARLLSTMTSEDLSNLEIVLSTNVSLEEAIPVFLQTGKNVDATINALRKAGTI